MHCVAGTQRYRRLIRAEFVFGAAASMRPVW